MLSISLKHLLLLLLLSRVLQASPITARVKQRHKKKSRNTGFYSNSFDVIKLRGGSKEDNSESTSRKRGSMDHVKRGRPKKVRKSEFGNIRTIEAKEAKRLTIKERILAMLKEEESQLKERMKKAIKEQIHRPEGVSDDVHKMRQLCRVSYHIKSEQDDENFLPIVNVYNGIFNDFMNAHSYHFATFEKATDDQGVISNDVYKTLVSQAKEKLIDEAEDADELSINLSVHQIMCRRCDTNCVPFEIELAVQVYDELDKFTSSDDVNIPSVVIDAVRDFRKCYQGLRSMATRLDQLHQVYESIESLKTFDIDKGVEVFIESQKFSRRLSDRILKEFEIVADRSHHHYINVVDRYGDVIQAFENRMQKTTDKFCGVCHMLSCKAHFQNMKKSVVAYALSKEKGEECEFCDFQFDCTQCSSEVIPVCRICIRQIRQRKVPASARLNGLVFDEEPEVLKSLNPIEKMLIKKYRVLQSIVNLRDVSGRITNVKGVGGAMVVVPTSMETTVKHVVSKLPSAKHMRIFVHSNWDKTYIVCMERVVRALEWLQCNNPHYKDVEIVRDFRFKIGEDVQFEISTSSQTDADKLTRLEASNGELSMLKHILYEPIQNVNQPAPPNESLQHFQLQKHDYKPVDKKDVKTDVLAFAEIFPKGRGGMHQIRDIPLQPSSYLRAVLLNKSREIATNIHWLCFQYAYKLQNAIASCQGVQARITNGKTKEDFDITDPEQQKWLSTVFQKVRGFVQFWIGIKNRLSFQILYYGLPTFFVTLNPNEREWIDLHEIYSELKGRPVNADTIKTEIEKDPAIFSRYWNRRLKNFFNTVIKDEIGPLGKIHHHFWRIEYQHRGTQHAHCLLWARDAPKAGCTEAELARYIDTYITCRMPEKDEGLLRELVLRHQVHASNPHMATCERWKKMRGRMFKICRFGFPRPLSPRTYVKKTGRLQKTRLYDLNRNSGEEYINDYAPGLLLAWKGNVDVQYVGSNKDVVSYITAYSTKGEVAKKMKEMREETFNDRNKAIYALGIDEINSRQTGLLEITDELLGNPSFEFDSAETWIPTDQSDKRTRMLRSKKEREETGLMFRTNLVDDYYPNRHPDLEDFCLYNVATNFEATSKPVKDMEAGYNPEEEDDEGASAEYNNNNISSPFYSHGQLAKGYGMNIKGTNVKFVKRKQKIGRFYIPQHDEKNPAQVEDFYRRMCMLFIPWRTETLIMESCGKETYYDTFIEHMDRMEKTSKEAYEDLISCLKNFKDMREEKKHAREKSLKLRKDMEEMGLEDMAKEIQVTPRNVDLEHHVEVVRHLNEQQKQLFNMVIESISESNVQLYVSGTAGVGKTFVIDAIADELEILFGGGDDPSQPITILAAPTGLAALSIRGLTLHSLLLIPVNQGKAYEGKYVPLRDDQRGFLQHLFSKVKLIVIDEISMVSAVMLMKINYRLQEISGTRKPFGGFNLAVFGDLLQLPPVGKYPIYKGIDYRAVTSVFGGCGTSVNLWKQFSFFELSQNMRQKEDLAYAEILGRVRTLQQTEDDLTTLSSRSICPNTNTGNLMDSAVKYYLDLKEQDPSVMALFSLTKEVNEFNHAVLKNSKQPIIVVQATETSASNQSCNKTRRPYSDKNHRLTSNNVSIGVSDSATIMLPVAGGLSARLLLSLNCRVMLRRNIDRVEGLVNGITGTLVETKEQNGEIVQLGIRFDRFPDKTVWVSKYSSVYDVKRNVRRTRTQFPVEVAYAATVHKSQGLTMKNVMLSMQSMFSEAQFYVAASRVTALQGLHLIDFDKTKIMIDADAVAEYGRLRCLADVDFTEPMIDSAAYNDSDLMERDVDSAHSRPIINTLNSPISRIIESPFRKLKVASKNKKYEGTGSQNALKLKNSGSDCFLNTIVNMINSSSTLRNRVMTLNRDIPVVAELQKLIERKMRSVQELRRCLPPSFHSLQQDVGEAMDSMLEEMPFDLLETIALVRKTRVRCSECGGISERETGVEMIHEIQRGPISMFQLFGNSTEEMCHSCSNGLKTTTLFYEIPQNTVNLMIRVSKTAPNQLISDILTDSFPFGGYQWRITSLAEYRPDGEKKYGKAGHYVCWVSLDGRWVCINDDTVEEHEYAAIETREITFMLLEKVSL